MSTYFITAWCDRTFRARCEVDAESPHEALAKARKAIDDSPAEECDGGYPWDEWRVDSQDTEGVLLHQDDDVRVRCVAPKLLAALKDVHGELPWLQDDECRFCGRDYEDVGPVEHCDIDCPGEIARAAIAQATGRTA